MARALESVCELVLEIRELNLKITDLETKRAEIFRRSDTSAKEFRQEIASTESQVAELENEVRTAVRTLNREHVKRDEFLEEILKLRKPKDPHSPRPLVRPKRKPKPSRSSSKKGHQHHPIPESLEKEAQEDVDKEDGVVIEARRMVDALAALAGSQRELQESSVLELLESENKRIDAIDQILKSAAQEVGLELEHMLTDREESREVLSTALVPSILSPRPSPRDHVTPEEQRDELLTQTELVEREVELYADCILLLGSEIRQATSEHERQWLHARQETADLRVKLAGACDQLANMCDSPLDE